jgi:hypothetical protein
MNEFDAVLKRGFAEAHEPADDGFSVHVGHAVARHEKALQIRNYVQNAGMSIGGAAALWGAYSFAGAMAPEIMANLGLEVARIHGALSGAPTVTTATGDAFGQAGGMLASLGAGLTQILLVMGVLAGGAVAYRAAQQD